MTVIAVIYLLLCTRSMEVCLWLFNIMKGLVVKFYLETAQYSYHTLLKVIFEKSTQFSGKGRHSPHRNTSYVVNAVPVKLYVGPFVCFMVGYMIVE